MTNKEKLEPQGIMFVLSSPSGAGKTTLSRALLVADPKLVMSVSCTTRKKRQEEIEGHDYFFLTKDKFEEMRENDEFLEAATVFDEFYGTPRKYVEENIQNNKDVLFDIDWQGTKALKEKVKDKLVSVFILPPSIEELERRLKNRGQDSQETVAKRMSKAREEISHFDSYDYVIVNHEVHDSLKKIQSIITAERSRRTNLPQLTEFIASLTK